MFIPATLKPALEKKYGVEIKKAAMTVRVVVRSGRSLKNILKKSDTFKSWCTKQEIKRGVGSPL